VVRPKVIETTRSALLIWPPGGGRLPRLDELSAQWQAERASTGAVGEHAHSAWRLGHAVRQVTAA